MGRDMTPGEKLGLAGSSTAAANAGDQWVDSAMAAADRFLRLILNSPSPAASFQIAHVRAYAEKTGVAPPPDARAWGHVARRLKKAGRVVPAGIGRSVDPVQHHGFTTEWRAAP